MQLRLITFLIIFSNLGYGQKIELTGKGGIDLVEKKYQILELDSTVKLIDKSFLKSKSNSRGEAVIIFYPMNSSLEELEDNLLSISSENCFNSGRVPLIAIRYKRDAFEFKNPYIGQFCNSKDSLIRDLSFFVFSNETDLMHRSEKINEIDIDTIITSKSISGCHKIILNKNFCVDDLAKRLPKYAAFIGELFDPEYSDKERLIMLEESYQDLLKENSSQKEYLKKLEKRIQDLEKPHIQAEVKKRSTKK